MRRNIKSNKNSDRYAFWDNSSKRNKPSKQLNAQFNFFEILQQQQNSIYTLFEDLYPFYRLNSFTSIVLALTLSVQFFKLFIFNSSQSQLFKVNIFTQLVETFVYANFMLIYGAYIQFRNKGWFLTLYAMCQICGYFTAILYSWSINLHNFHLLTTTYSLYYLILNQHRFDSKVKLSINFKDIFLKIKTTVNKWTTSDNVSNNNNNNVPQIKTKVVPDFFQSFSSQKQFNVSDDFGAEDNFNFDSFFSFQQNPNIQKNQSKNKSLQKNRKKQANFKKNIDFDQSFSSFNSQFNLNFQQNKQDIFQPNFNNNNNDLNYNQQQGMNNNDLSTIDQDFISKEKQSNKNQLIKIYKCIIFSFLVYCTTTKLQFITFAISSVWIMLFVQVILNSKLRTLKIACCALLIIIFIFIIF